MKKKVVIGIILVLVGIQFLRIDKKRTKTVAQYDFITITQPEEKIKHMLQAACYDCHSNSTVYPWYANIAPVSWWLQHHIKEAKEHLNFSEWGTYNEEKRKHKLHECYEEIEEGEMPLTSYAWMHKEAKLSKQQREELTQWFQSFGPFDHHDNDKLKNE